MIEYAGGDMVTSVRQTTYAFDPITGALAEAESPEGTIDYAHDDATGRLMRTFTASTETAYGYDELGRLQHVYQVKVNGDSGGISVTGWDETTQEPVFTGEGLTERDTTLYFASAGFCLHPGWRCMASCRTGATRAMRGMNRRLSGGGGDVKGDVPFS